MPVLVMERLGRSRRHWLLGEWHCLCLCRWLGDVLLLSERSGWRLYLTLRHPETKADLVLLILLPIASSIRPCGSAIVELNVLVSRESEVMLPGNVFPWGLPSTHSSKYPGLCLGAGMRLCILGGRKQCFTWELDPTDGILELMDFS